MKTQTIESIRECLNHLEKWGTECQVQNISRLALLRLEKLEAEHAALLAVAEAAQKQLRHLPGEYHDNASIELHKAILNLATIRQSSNQ